ncbi:unnamed protein product [Pylaiella littoralis]
MRIKRTSIAQWASWLQGNRRLGAERAAREAAAEAFRLSRALQCFKKSCARNKRHRHLQVALRTLRALTQRRPIERARGHWQNIVRLIEANAVFGAWAAAMQHQRRLETATQSVCSRKEVMLVTPIWERWRRRAGASTLASLLHAWAVVGPVRRAVGIIRGLATEARARERLRHRLLRKGLTHGFATFVVGQRRSKFAASQAQGHDRRRALRRSIHRWLVRHRLAQSVTMWQHRVEKARRQAFIKQLVSLTVIASIACRCAAIHKKHVHQHSLRVHAIDHSSRLVSVRKQSRLWYGLKQWRDRAISSQRLQRRQDAALMMRRVRSLRIGLAGFTWWKQVSNTAYDARSSLQARSVSVAISCWRRNASGFRCQHNLECCASLHFSRKSLAAGLSLWQKRAAYAADAHFTIRYFKLQWGMHLGIVRLRRWIENRRASRLRVWRAGLRAEASGATSALKIWRRHAQAQTEIETSARIAHNRNQTRRSCCSPSERHLFGVLKRHALARKLERRVLRTWFSHTERKTRGSKQARAFLLRCGLQGLRRRVRVSEFRRDRRLRTSGHRNHMIVRAKFNAWKNMWYPLGLPVQWGPRIRPYTNSDNREAKSSARIPQEHWKKLALRSRESRCLETTEAARAQDWESSSGCASLVSLRLPLIGQRVRRVLYVWRKRAKTKARVRLIRNTPEGSEFRAVGEPFSDLNIGMNVRYRSEHKGYLHLHMLNTSDKKTLPIC